MDYVNTEDQKNIAGLFLIQKSFNIIIEPELRKKSSNDFETLMNFCRVLLHKHQPKLHTILWTNTLLFLLNDYYSKSKRRNMVKYIPELIDFLNHFFQEFNPDLVDFEAQNSRFSQLVEHYFNFCLLDQSYREQVFQSLSKIAISLYTYRDKSLNPIFAEIYIRAFKLRDYKLCSTLSSFLLSNNEIENIRLGLKKIKESSSSDSPVSYQISEKDLRQMFYYASLNEFQLSNFENSNYFALIYIKLNNLVQIQMKEEHFMAIYIINNFLLSKNFDSLILSLKEKEYPRNSFQYHLSILIKEDNIQRLLENIHTRSPIITIDVILKAIIILICQKNFLYFVNLINLPRVSNILKQNGNCNLIISETLFKKFLIETLRFNLSLFKKLTVDQFINLFAQVFGVHTSTLVTHLLTVYYPNEGLTKNCSKKTFDNDIVKCLFIKYLEDIKNYCDISITIESDPVENETYIHLLQNSKVIQNLLVKNNIIKS
ncbi:uncharacterized protein ASCRUDRAFT_68105 [Ascoidea rubescens DSM 1968]|uniref:Uncharacterized protein n=1 Tax=Ascoidea rubescens DSM 1968 TaxID=1344418 RepID=A0A1D2VR56_9ASCO|nr:hypothetical protein ASCRUDRAFT_68105 [Ascoidea rubescens DSM 1968]ODV64079.1 hypothetical protein ASCRUDRAFT_68105 [Ascoidea rubescens DSM 1968]